jgi:hypothetical protein
MLCRRAKFNAFFLPLEDASSLIVPVLTIFEVFKVVLREAGEDEALQSIAAMQKQDAPFKDLPGVKFFPKIHA